MKEKIKILCTLGPSSLNKKTLNFFKKNIDYFRLNMSHLTVKNLTNIIQFLKSIKINNICLDTEGAQVRTGSIIKKQLIKGQKIKIFNNSILKKGSKQISFYPSIEFSKLKINTKILIGFDDLQLKIISIKKDFIIAKVISSGLIESNKGVHFQQNNISLHFLTNKDHEAIKIAKKLGVKVFALSFASNETSVRNFRKLIGKKSLLISKIETLKSLKNIKKISQLSDAILIDRGDLSRYVPIEQIPQIQKEILNISKKMKTDCFVATNLLETMIEKKTPTRAESNDIFSTLENGANGLVLAAETAIGSYPIECVKFLKKCINTKKKFSLRKYF